MRFNYLWVAAALCAPALEAGELTFRLHVLDANAQHHGCAVMDVDGDGQLDVISGGWWYQGPEWKRHFVRDVEQIRGRYDDYSHLPLDVNGDGFLDLISANYRSQSIYWVEHPGKQLTAWRKHEIARPGAMETGRLADVDGDGDEDLLPNGVQFAAWWELDRGTSPPRWQQHDLPDAIAGHGIGFGDINGDGRGDIVGPRGWLEAPQDRRQGVWHFHADFELDRDSSIPILVWDVDADGDQDIVWGRGHHIGLYWLEQQRDEAGRSTWQRHTIDTSWSQAHSILSADLDNDGELELVAGKRYLGHDGKDPGEWDPLVAYWYDFDPARRTWVRSEIASRQPTGFGLDPKVADLDQDGDMDVIVADRCGLYWLENELRGGAYSDPSQLLVLRAGDGAQQPVTTPAAMALRRQHILDSIQRVMGRLPDAERRVPLDVQVLAEEDAGAYVRRRIEFTAEPQDRVPAYLLIPKELQSPAPAMLCLHQTTTIGKGEPAGLGGRPSLHYAHELAQRGYVCLVPDYPSFGDYDYDFQSQGGHYASGSMKAIWNNLRAVDLLVSLPEVHRDRIGCIGHSLGGHNSLFTAAFDQRIRAVITSCGFTPFHHYYGGRLQGWTSDRYMPRIRDVYENDPDRMPFDFYGVLASIAPRAIFVNAPLRDSNFAVEGVRLVEAQLPAVYDLYGSPHRAMFVYPDSEHDFPDAVRQQAYQWLDEQW